MFSKLWIKLTRLDPLEITQPHRKSSSPNVLTEKDGIPQPSDLNLPAWVQFLFPLFSQVRAVSEAAETQWFKKQTSSMSRTRRVPERAPATCPICKRLARYCATKSVGISQRSQCMGKKFLIHLETQTWVRSEGTQTPCFIPGFALWRILCVVRQGRHKGRLGCFLFGAVTSHAYQPCPPPNCPAG